MPLMWFAVPLPVCGGGMAVAITRTELDAAGFRRATAQSRGADAARRMLALALVLDGQTRKQAAEVCGVEPRGSPDMNRQTLRDWVHRYNDQGLPGLSDRVPPGPASRLSPEQEAVVARLVRDGPTLSEHGVIRWRRADLSRVIQARFAVCLAERSVGDLLRRLGFRRLSARPRHPGHDATAQEAHRKTLPVWSRPAFPNTPAASRLNSGGRTKLASTSKAP